MEYKGFHFIALSMSYFESLACCLENKVRSPGDMEPFYNS